MKRISEIEFVNYKAFYQKGDQNKIIIPEGKSVLLYGENGSGKSSIYEGLKQFFNSSNNTIETIPSRHIRVSKTRIENEGEDNQAEVSNEVAVKVTFTDANGNEVKTFGVPANDTQGTNYITRANLLNSFISYRELLRTYLMENPKNREEFRLKFAQLLVEVILFKQRNSVTQQTFQKSWEDLFIPRARYKEFNCERFTRGLAYEINRINLLLPTLLKYFEDDFSVQLVLTKSIIDYYHSDRENREGYYPICEVDLKVSLFGEPTENDEENHLTVLNEARLSSLAISIYLASLINTPQDNFDFKILFLDDIFIGLDMSNRLPLLHILKSYKKPIIEQLVDAQQDNIIVERIQKVGDIVRTEALPFFSNYQIFISTYDRFWFEVAKKELDTKSPGKWCYLEMFANQKEGLTFATPLLYTSLNYLQKADYYYTKHDYPSCANHLRKALEQRLKELLPANRHYAEYPDAETGEKEIKKIRTLNQYLEKFISYCDENGINANELTDLKNLKDWYFNPFSHDNISTPIFRKELENAKTLVEKLYQFEISVLVEAGTNLFFQFSNAAGETREYKIRLIENIRHILSEGQNVLTDAKVICYEWNRNGTTINPDWGEYKLFHFYNNKKNAFLNTPDQQLDKSVFWDVIHLEQSGLPLNSKLALP